VLSKVDIFIIIMALIASMWPTRKKYRYICVCMLNFRLVGYDYFFSQVNGYCYLLLLIFILDP
jgi:hypothetical protein